jgi:Protein of unknown function (DUF1501)
LYLLRAQNLNSTSSQFGCSEFRRAGKLNRRSVLQAGGLSALGLGMTDLQARLALANEVQAASGKRAKACILLFMWGGPSQLETFDPKPNAPDEVRGDFKAIPTKVPGINISEHFTRLSQLTDKISIIRSLTHDDLAHLSSAHTTLTGKLPPVEKTDDVPPSANDSPHLGALLSKLRPGRGGVPSFVSMPWKAYHPAAPGGIAPGQHGGWLGSVHDGMMLTGDLNLPEWRPQGLTLPADITLDRLESRTSLLQLLDDQRATMRQANSIEALHAHQSRAIEMLASNKVRDAFDLNQESTTTRELYGRNIHGQCVLMARRLVEHGVSFVSVNWHNDGKTFWDTHGNNFKRLKDDLIPPADQALSALLTDLEQRGMLDETIVAWVGEFGRRPQITKNNAGREHWPFCYNGILAGGGIRRGFVYGSSDDHAAYPTDSPVSPHDFASTILHAMGISTDEVLLDRQNRPHQIASGRVIQGLFA